MGASEHPWYGERPDPLLTVRQAAGYLNVHPQTIRKMVKTGRLEATDVGSGNRRHLRFKKTDLDAVLTPVHPSPKRDQHRSLSRDQLR